MPISRNNFTSLPVAAEQEGVDVSFFTVDFINGMNSETGDPQADSTSTSGYHGPRNQHPSNWSVRKLKHRTYLHGEN